MVHVNNNMRKNKTEFTSAVTTPSLKWRQLAADREALVVGVTVRATVGAMTLLTVAEATAASDLIPQVLTVNTRTVTLLACSVPLKTSVISVSTERLITPSTSSS